MFKQAIVPRLVSDGYGTNGTKNRIDYNKVDGFFEVDSNGCLLQLERDLTIHERRDNPDLVKRIYKEWISVG